MTTLRGFQDVERLVIRHGLVVTPTNVAIADIAVENERIAEIGDSLQPRPGDAEIDASNMTIFPGAIDGHSHFIISEPGFQSMDPEEYEGLTNGGSAAAAGGITTVIEMPHSAPPATTGPRLRRKREIGEPSAIVDFALWGGIVAGQHDQDLFDQLTEGAVGLKAYMADSDPTFPGVSDAQLVQTLQLLSDSGVMLGLHAESDALLKDGVRRMKASGRTDPLSQAESRPPIVEIEAVFRSICYAEYTGGWVHIVHLTTPQAAELVRAAKGRGVRVTCETCPQYLALDLDDQAHLGPYVASAPAIRSRALVDELWEYVVDGTIDAITSDHCAYTISSKEAGRANIWNGRLGVSAVQTLLPVMLTEGPARGLSLGQIAALCATRPAELWGLDDRKGAIEVGRHADLAIVDMRHEWTLDRSELLHTHKWSPFEGRTFIGRITRTIVRGRTVFLDDATNPILVDPGFGRWLPRRDPPSSPYTPAKARTGSEVLQQ